MDGMEGGDNSCPSCNRELLPADLTIHKLFCAQFASLPPRPASSHVLGLVFPQGPAAGDQGGQKAIPTPTWIKRTSSTDDETSITFQVVDVAPVFSSVSGTDSATPEAIYTERNRVRNRDTTSMLEIWTMPATAESNQSENGSIAALVTDGARTFHRWTGPVLALAMTRATGFMVDPGSYRDVTLEDAADVVDFLVDHENPEHERRIRAALETLGTEKPTVEATGKAPGTSSDRDEAVEKEEREDGEGGKKGQDVVFEVL